MENIIGLALLLLLIVIFIGWVVKIVREYQRVVVFRLGRNIGEKGPGIVLVLPIVDQVVWVDLREQFLEIPAQACITQDNATISVDFLIYWKVLDAANSVIQVKNFAGASQGIATTTLRAVIGDISLDNVLAQREHINNVLREKLDEVTGRWGVKITAVEIREILPPRDIQEAMTRQMSAERNRRAGGHCACRGLRTGSGQDLYHRQDHRRQDHEPAVPRSAQGAGRRARHQVYLPARVPELPQALRRFRRQGH
jgi:regulator of protease activity HflC (stomatin/prohibitin superfamily)